METKVCTGCEKCKSLDQFSFQKKNPGKYYAWCDSCRKNAPKVRVNCKLRRQEYLELKSKSQSLRSLPDDKVSLVSQYRSEGMRPQIIANKLGVPEIVVKRTLAKLERMAV